MKSSVILFVLLCSFCLIANGLPAAPDPARPNIVLILADDIGYGDLSCYGAKLVQTPNLDKLAGDGRRFTDFHSPASTCSPSRRALLTGTYSWRQRPGSAIMRGDAPLSIEPGSPTLPSMLKKAGYTTGLVGKWHLGLGDDNGPNWNADIKPGPLELGFDYAFFFPATGDRVPCVYIENHRVVNLDPADPITVSYDHKVGSEPTGRENPGLLKLRATDGHDNTIVNGIGRIGWMSGGQSARWNDETIMDTFTTKAVEFIAQHKAEPFFLYFATHDIHVPRVPNPRFNGKSACGRRGDAIVQLDDVVGRVVAALEKEKLLENTLIMFSSDNGGIMNDGYEDGMFDHKCNGNLRGRKGTIWEGGNRVPLIARWPGHIKAGSESSEMFTLLDMYATLAALTGQELPQDAAPDSYNALPALLGTPHPAPVRPEFITHIGGIKGPFGVRQGTWKLDQAVPGKNSAATTPTAELYDLSTDLAEAHDLAAQNPQKVRELEELLARIKTAGRSQGLTK